MNVVYTLLPFLLCIFVTISPEESEIDIYCRKKDRLITSDELDKYMLIGVEMNVTLRLDCQYCHESIEDIEPRIWYFHDRRHEKKQREVELGMNNNMSANRITVDLQFNLIIRDFREQDAGIYECRGPQEEDSEKKFNYRLEPVFQVSEYITPQRGTLADWERFRELNYLPVTIRFQLSLMGQLLFIREAGIILEVIAEWSDWGPCQKCVNKHGTQTSRSLCRLKRRYGKRTYLGWETNRVLDFFRSSPLLPCRAQVLSEDYPVVSKALRELPEFILEKTCKNCKHVKKVKPNKFKYKKKYIIAAGSHLTIACPESDLDSHVVWQKGNTILKPGSGFSLNKNDNEDRVLVDTFSTLYFHEITSEEEGNYTCYVNDVKMMQVKVTVLSRRTILTRVMLRHMSYLGFIILLSSFCYCAGLVVVCRQRKKYTKKDYKTIRDELENKKEQLKKLWDRLEEEEGGETT